MRGALLLVGQRFSIDEGAGVRINEVLERDAITNVSLKS